MYGGQQPPGQWGQQQAPQFQPQQQQHQQPPHQQFQQQQQQQQQQFNPQQQFRHAGLGAPGAAANLPRPPNLAPPPSRFGPTASGFPGVVPSQAWNGEKFSLFVGSIADGLEDGWLERILGTAGPVLSLRRPSPAFAFVEYGDPESVLRCLEVVNGAKLVGKGGVEKVLLVKADEKTRARLDQYESGRTKNDQTAEFLLRAKEDLEAIVRLMRTGDAPATSSFASTNPTPALPAPPTRNTPSHLQDLVAEDLPDASRGIITSEIALFRERAAQRAKEQKEQDLAAEMRRHAPQSDMSRAPQQQGNAWGSRGGQQDPQSYNKPIGFVGAGTAVGAAKEADARPSPPPVDEALQERERAQRAQREAEALFRDRERRYEARERARIQGVERERGRERMQADQEDRDRVAMRERLAVWDDEREAEKGRELFYADRIRWRAQRRPLRVREVENDARDRTIEAQQAAALHKEAEDFLAQQAEMFAKITESKEKANAGALPSAGAADEPAVKLSFGAAATKVVTKTVVPVRSAVLGVGEDEEEGTKRRELIPLSYSDDEDDKPKASYRMSQKEKEKKAKEILARVPVEKEVLWVFKMPWSSLSEDILVAKISPFASKTIVEYLGGEEEELLTAVLDHLRAHKSASALVEELEPVLDEEATEFVRKIWKELVYELQLAQAGISL